MSGQIFQQFYEELANYSDSQLYLLVFINILAYNIIYFYTNDVIKAIGEIEKVKSIQFEVVAAKDNMIQMRLEGSNYKGAYGALSNPSSFQSNLRTEEPGPVASLRSDTKESQDLLPTVAEDPAPQQAGKVTQFQLTHPGKKDKPEIDSHDPRLQAASNEIAREEDRLKESKSKSDEHQ